MVLESPQIDFAAQASHVLTYTSAFDNQVNFNSISSVPAGMGLTAAFDGSSSAITATADGAWWFALGLTDNSQAVADATLLLQLQSGFGNLFVQWAPGSTVKSLPEYGEIVYLTSGTSQNVRVTTETAATAGTYNMRWYVVVTRIA